MKKKDFKLRSQLTPLVIIILCVFSFYLGGIYYCDNTIANEDTRPTVQTLKETSVTSLQIKSIAFPECSNDYQDYTPCTDPKVNICFRLLLNNSTVVVQITIRLYYYEMQISSNGP